MKLAYFGDVVGRSGRRALGEHLPRLRAELQFDFVCINAENAAGGFGITESVAEELYGYGADCLTLGNHAWDQREALTYIAREPRLLRPNNYPERLDIPGRGAEVYTLPSGARVGVILTMGRIFMDPLDDPFCAVERDIESLALGQVVDALILDVHAEATSEKMAMGHQFDGRASLVVGSHTHVPTADTRILSGGTAFQTDAGMCGDYDSVVGMRKDRSLRKFTTRLPGERNEPADGEGTVCGVYVETDDRTGLAVRCEPIRIGGELEERVPRAEGEGVVREPATSALPGTRAPSPDCGRGPG